MFHVNQFRQFIVDVLNQLDPSTNSPAAVNLLMGTAAQESQFGTYLTQIRGPALGVFQMEPATEKDIWENYLKWRPQTIAAITKMTGLTGPDSLHLTGNLIYQVIMARMHYRRVPRPLPASDNIKAMAAYWKDYYNTHLGRGTVDEFVHNYQRYITAR